MAIVIDNKNANWKLRIFNDYYDWEKNCIGVFDEKKLKVKKNRDYSEKFTKEYIEKRIGYSSKWYGTDNIDEVMNKKMTYLYLSDSKKVYDTIKEKAVNVEIEEAIKKKRLKFNRYGFGTFSFDRASMIMTAIKEYESPSLNKILQQENVYKKDSEWLANEDDNIVYQRDKINEKTGKKQIKSSVDDSFAYFPLEKKSASVELYLLCGGNADKKAEEFLYTPISMLYLAQQLELAGIAVQINAVIGSKNTETNNKDKCGSVIPIKLFNETCDINLLSIILADPRFFRHEGFKSIISGFDYFGIGVSEGYGTYPSSKSEIDDILDSIETSNTPSIKYMFSGIYSIDAAVNQYNEIATKIINKLKI